ncbi:hypothetical protein COK54_13125 [Bacillus cereus]|uniref:putative sensor domain DACNV-containing protein n=1 Tax=Bacillus cereus TaxID=1396 RepID=UPI000BEBFE33|nr:hypothetical protein [Bacillus cereus]PEC77389.1 hypothetical protein CON08_22690 [Bacillus cereus]PFS94581.1 hypothetical protein COK54_13125 [Bacillus cereus]
MVVNDFLYPKDLAVEVYHFILKEEISNKFTIENLTNLFEIMYFASLKTEESESISSRITIIDKDSPDPKPPKRIVKDRWSYIKFKEEVELTIPNLVKISKAADPKAGSLAVDLSNGKFVIWGMIDQEYHYYNCLLNESEMGPERPGLFEVIIESLGEISVFKDYRNIASLKKNILINKQNDVLNLGPISNKLGEYLSTYIDNEAHIVKTSSLEGREPEEVWLKWELVSIICRILINIKEYRHGGAVLFDPKLDDSFMDLSIKYEITYERISKSLSEYVRSFVEKRALGYYIRNESGYKNDGNIPYPVFIDNECLKIDVEEYKNGLTGAVKFISSLTCVDGLVLFDKNLCVRGFGVEITARKEPDVIYLASEEEISEHDLKKVDYKHFGTRHRSMMRYCYTHPKSIGFVISQDGDIRAITNVNGKVIMWENIKIAQFLR